MREAGKSHFDVTAVLASFTTANGELEGTHGDLRTTESQVTSLADLLGAASQADSLSHQLTDAIATAVTPSFPPFTGTFSDPVTQSEMQAFANYVESFRQFLAR